MQRIYKDTIEAFAGSWGSGIATLEMKSGASVPGDSGPMGRALEDAFEGAIGPGHTISNRAIKGRTIFYEMEDWGTMAWLAPADRETSAKVAKAVKAGAAELIDKTTK